MNTSMQIEYNRGHIKFPQDEATGGVFFAASALRAGDCAPAWRVGADRRRACGLGRGDHQRAAGLGMVAKRGRLTAVPTSARPAARHR
jgi:hypothetical protein